MPKYLCEVGCEEIPARFLPSLINELTEKTTAACDDARIVYKSIVVYATYRRLVLMIDGIAKSQLASSLTQRGPKVDIGKDDQGNFLPPAIGFAKRFNVTPDQLSIVNEEGTDYFAFTQNETGQPTKDVLPTIISDIFKGLPCPIAMTWGQADYQFIRPIHWILSLLDSTHVPITFFGISSGTKSYGHRLLTNNKKDIASGVPLKIASPETYLDQLKEQFVLVDHHKRKKKIQTGLLQVLSSKEIDQTLLDEVVFLLEWPTVLQGQFDRSYLNIPAQVLIECMRKHQKYFPVYQKRSLTNQFLVAADNVTTKNKSTILSGNENVLKARLEDAAFFYHEDSKVSLEKRRQSMQSVVFQKNMGSMYDKMERLTVTATYLNKALKLGVPSKEVKAATTLCKSDLSTHMVIEFPSLQGVMGKIYAKKEGLPKAVSDAIFEHYLPRYASDQLPKTNLGILVSLSDKLDTMVACFINTLIPSGSQDPWGVRRLSNGLFAIIFEHRLSLSLTECLDAVYKTFPGAKTHREDLDTFLLGRAKGFYSDQGLAYDLVDAVLDGALEDPLITFSRGKALEHDRERQAKKFKHMVETAVRVQRIAKTKKNKKVNPNLFQDKIERTAYDTLLKLQKVSLQICKNKEYSKLVALLHALSGPLTQYFDEVLVMHKDKKIQENRLAFLSECSIQYETLAQFEKVVLS